MSKQNNPIGSLETAKLFRQTNQKSLSTWKWLLPMLVLLAIGFWLINQRSFGRLLGSNHSAVGQTTAENGAGTQALKTGKAMDGWSAATIADSIRSNGSVGFDDKDVHFTTGSATLASGSQAALDQTSEALRSNPTWRMQVVGNVDSLGSASEKQELARRRATSVMAYLTSHGVNVKKLSVDTDGDTNPVTSNPRKSGKNVELVRQLEVVN